jgi:hypothetical protein
LAERICRHCDRSETCDRGEGPKGALDAFGNAMASVREVWEPETTARNLRIIREPHKKAIAAARAGVLYTE